MLLPGAAAAGPAGLAAGHQQQASAGRIRLVCENDPAVDCPDDPETYCIPGGQSGKDNRIFHQVCNPGQTVPTGGPGFWPWYCTPNPAWNACVPVITARASGSLQVSAREIPAPDGYDCTGQAPCIQLQIDARLELAGAAAPWSRSYFFTTYDAFDRSPDCRDASTAGGLRISDWFPFRSRDCVFDEGLNFAGMLIPTNWTVQTQWGEEQPLSGMESQLNSFAGSELGLPIGNALPTTMRDSEHPAGCTGGVGCDLPGNAIFLRSGDRISDGIDPITGTRTVVHPIEVRFAAVKEPAAPGTRALERFATLATTTAPDDAFGDAMDASGEFLVVGATFEDRLNEVNAGSAYVYRFDGTAWNEFEKLQPTRVLRHDRFGAAVAISGDRIVVGAFGDDIGANEEIDNVGSAYVFRFHSAQQRWGPDPEVQLFASSPQAFDQLGGAVDIDSGKVILGAAGSPSQAVQTGQWFRAEAPGWVLQRWGWSSGAARLGAAVALRNGVSIAGAPATIWGRAQIYDGTSKLVYPDECCGFGEAVRIAKGSSPPVVIVGAPGASALYAYRLDGSSWMDERKEQKLSASDGVPIGTDDSGLAFDGERLVVASASPGEALAYVFRFDGDRFHEVAKLVSEVPPSAVSSVAISGTTVFVGADGEVSLFDTTPLDLVVEGTATGGEVTFSMDGRSLRVATRSGETARSVSARLANHLVGHAINAVFASSRQRIELNPELAGAFSVASTDPGLAVQALTDCRDGLDDDGDGLVDLADPGCASANDVSERSPVLPCDDGVDNDGDGHIDLADPECINPSSPTESAACADGLDNDGDGRIDFGLVSPPADGGCASAEDPDERGPCSDGLDNDGDGLVDYPADPSCVTALDNSVEAQQCENGIDDDADGLIDYPADPDCASPAGIQERKGCGMGGELVLVLPMLLCVRALRRRHAGARWRRAGE